MSKYHVTVNWNRNGQHFIDNAYKRTHSWKFNCGQTIKASASSQIVPPPLSDPTVVDPEEAFVASLSSCHMLWFLSIAAQKGFIIEEYIDKAEGTMAENTEGKQAITHVILSPHVIYLNDAAPSNSLDQEMHNLASDRCFIANSVKTSVQVNASMEKKAEA